MRNNVARKLKDSPVKSVYTSLRVPTDVRTKLETIAKAEERSVSNVAVLCIKAGLAAREQQAA